MKKHSKQGQGGRPAQQSTQEHTAREDRVARSIAGSIHAHMDADWEEHRTGEVWKMAGFTPRKTSKLIRSDGTP